MPSFVSTINFIDCFFFEWLTPFVIRLVRLADCKSKTYPSCSTQCHNRVTRSCSVFHRLSSLNPSHSKFLLTVSSGFLVLGGSAITRLSNQQRDTRWLLRWLANSVERFPLVARIFEFSNVNFIFFFQFLFIKKNRKN